jgi:peptidoglycan L-alanyl-D-glutamate endopeptidase CwlK
MAKGKNKILTIIFLTLITIIGFTGYICPNVIIENGKASNNPVHKSNSDIPAGLSNLVKAYPDFIDSADCCYIYWKDGTKMKYDDGIENKDYESMLENPSLKDQMSMPYPPGENYDIPPKENFDPGRIRNEDFFRKMYGSSESEVRSHLVSINWLPNNSGKKILITTVNGVDKALQNVSNELDQLSPDMLKYVKRLGGTFNWRPILNTNRLSPHSYGIAIDINTTYSNYWEWEKGSGYTNRIPMEIVEVFEKYGFIWGGKWYHYDTMHFEYRPELLLK